MKSVCVSCKEVPETEGVAASVSVLYVILWDMFCCCVLRCVSAECVHGWLGLSGSMHLLFS